MDDTPEPSFTERMELLRWVNSLPQRESVTGYRALHDNCAQRYHHSPDHLSVVINSLTENYREILSATLKARRETLSGRTASGHKGGSLPTPEEMREASDKALAAVLLKMWAYANEHSQRYNFPRLAQPIEEEDLAKFLSSLEGE